MLLQGNADIINAYQVITNIPTVLQFTERVLMLKAKLDERHNSILLITSRPWLADTLAPFTEKQNSQKITAFREKVVEKESK